MQNSSSNVIRFESKEDRQGREIVESLREEYAKLETRKIEDLHPLDDCDLVRDKALGT